LIIVAFEELEVRIDYVFGIIKFLIARARDLVVSFGVGFTLWARQLSLPWPIVIGALFLIEGLSTLIAALTEWWRLSTVGLAIGIMICGFGFPLVAEGRRFVLVGAAVFFGGLLSGGILYWQLCRKDRLR